MVIKARGELITPTDQVNLTVQFRDQLGQAVDADSFPTISIVQPNGSILLAPTTQGVAHTAVGQYSYVFTAGINPAFGIYNDIWTGSINGFQVQSTFNFLINNSDVPSAPNSDGYVQLGDDPGFNYSQIAILNINKLLKALKARLSSEGKIKSADSYGNTIYVTCDIFSTDMLVTFLGVALSEFNQIPYFTFFTFEDTQFIEQFLEILVEGATLYALASKALIERGREFDISDQGVTFKPPTVSELLGTQYSTLLTSYNERLKMIKNSMRPFPIGLGVFGITSAVNPLVRRLRFLRERRII